VHEEDAARRLAKAAAGAHLKLTEPSEGRVNLVAEVPGVLKVDAELLFRFNSLGDLMLATLPSNRYVKEGEVVAGTRTIPVLVKEDLVRKAEALCTGGPIVEILPVSIRKVHLIVTGSEVYTGRIKDGFEPIVRRKLGSMGVDLADKKLATDDADQIAQLILDAQQSGAELILVSGGMSVDPDDKSPEGIRRSGARIESHGFPVLPGSMFLLGYLKDTPILGLSGCVLHDDFSAFDIVLPRLLAGEKISRADVIAMGHGGLQRKHDH
jgi:molybdopterin biosynthesis enzyme